LLAKRQVKIPETISHVDLRTLLETGIPIDLPGNRRLFIKPIKKDSVYIGKRADECCPSEDEEEVDLVAVFRDNQLIFPHEKTQLKVGDRLLLIVSYNALPLHERQLEPR